MAATTSGTERSAGTCLQWCPRSMRIGQDVIPVCVQSWSQAKSALEIESPLRRQERRFGCVCGGGRWGGEEGEGEKEKERGDGLLTRSCQPFGVALKGWPTDMARSSCSLFFPQLPATLSSAKQPHVAQVQSPRSPIPPLQPPLHQCTNDLQSKVFLNAQEYDG
jgi:hypothetical protein